MIITKTPFRISFVGGGTDLPAFYESHGGAVVSMTINKYMYVILNKRSLEESIRIGYAQTENIFDLKDIQHDIVRETLKWAGINSGIEIVSVADIPGKGTGLGSSSSFAVGLLNALNQYKILHGDGKRYIIDLAEKAFEIEASKCEKPIGKQDHYAASHGGLRMYEFEQKKDEKEKNTNVVVTNLPSQAKEIDKYLLLFYTGLTRSSKEILQEQNNNLRDFDIAKPMCRMKELAYDMIHTPVNEWGCILHENWNLKRTLAYGITNHEIDRWYAAGRKAGADGGKICGAGGGGFLLFFAQPEYHQRIIDAVPLKHVPVKLDPKGTRIAYMEGFSNE